MRQMAFTLARGLALALLALALLAQPAQARFIRPVLMNVPISRIIANLEKQVAEKPADQTARFNLARAHAMAYASKSDTAPVRKGHEKAGVWFGFTPTHVPFLPVPTKDEAKQKEARAHLAKAITLYSAVVQAQPKNLTARLGHAWALEQSGARARAIAGYRLVVDLGWEREKDMKEGPLGWHSVTAEAARYLIPLLDPKTDKPEIDLLQDRIKVVRKIPRPVTPIVLPLRPGVAAERLVDRTARVAFDADGSGLKKRWTWVTPEAGWLVYDPRGTGKVGSALQMFGGVSFWMFWGHGYQALSALDDDGDGVLTGAELRGLAIWHDANGNGVCDPGEVRPLSAWGITAISCRAETSGTPSSCVAWARRGVRFRDGTWRPTFDVILTSRD